MPNLRTHTIDPVFEHSRREAVVILAVFAVFAAYTVGVSYLFGHQSPYEDPRPLKTTFGMPSWVFWGIVLPWLAANIITAWFCFFFMKHDDLGQDDIREDLPTGDVSGNDVRSNDAKVNDVKVNDG